MKTPENPQNETKNYKMAKSDEKTRKLLVISFLICCACGFAFIIFSTIMPDLIDANINERLLNERLDQIKNPVYVSSEEELKNILPGRDYILTDNITLSSDWKGIGTIESPFSGSLNGNGNVINTAAAANKTREFPGLIKYASGDCILQNIVLDDCYVLHGALIANITGNNGNILLYKCELKGDEIPYYSYYYSPRSLIAHNFYTNFYELLVGTSFFEGPQGIVTLSSTERYVEIIDVDNKNSIIFYDCTVVTPNAVTSYSEHVERYWESIDSADEGATL